MKQKPIQHSQGRWETEWGRGSNDQHMQSGRMRDRERQNRETKVQHSQGQGGWGKGGAGEILPTQQSGMDPEPTARIFFIQLLPQSSSSLCFFFLLVSLLPPPLLQITSTCFPAILHVSKQRRSLRVVEEKCTA